MNPPIEDAVATLKGRPELNAIIQFIADEREKCFGDMRQAETTLDVGKAAGSIATLTELKEILST